MRELVYSIKQMEPKHEERKRRFQIHFRVNTLVFGYIKRSFQEDPGSPTSNAGSPSKISTVSKLTVITIPINRMMQPRSLHPSECT